jgi:hypothetical protein
MNWVIKRNGNIIQQVVIDTRHERGRSNIMTATTQQMIFDTESAALEIANVWLDAEVVKAA